VAAVVVTWNRLTLLTECLTMLSAQGLHGELTRRPRPTRVVLAEAGDDLAPHW
jgi:GT2 family glycosyltransferase